MTTDERVEALRPFGFTARQTRFLAFVMTHSGVCLQRQYAAFAGIVHGEKTRRFFAKLVQLGLVSTYECAHNRARIYHVRHKALYQAIGAPDHRHRRPVPLPRAIERLMMLDAVLAHRGATLLTEVDEKVSHLETLAGVPRELMPRAVTAAGPQLFPDRLPIAVHPDGRIVFVYLTGATQPTAIYSYIYRHVAMLDRCGRCSSYCQPTPRTGTERQVAEMAVLCRNQIGAWLHAAGRQRDHPDIRPEPEDGQVQWTRASLVAVRYEPASVMPVALKQVTPVPITRSQHRRFRKLRANNRLALTAILPCTLLSHSAVPS